MSARPAKPVRRATKKPDATPQGPTEASKAGKSASQKPVGAIEGSVGSGPKGGKKTQAEPDLTEKGKDEYDKTFAKKVKKLEGMTEEEAGAFVHNAADNAIKAMELCINDSKEEATKIDAEKADAEAVLAKEEQAHNQAVADIQAKNGEVASAQEAVVAEEEKVQAEKVKLDAEVVQIQEKSKELLSAQKEQQDVDVKVEEFTRLTKLLDEDKEFELREVDVLNEVKRVEADILNAVDLELDRLEQLKAVLEKDIADIQAQRLALQGEIEILVDAIAQHLAQKVEFEKEATRLEKEAKAHDATAKTENDSAAKLEKEAKSTEQVANAAKIAAGIAFALGMAAAAFSFGIGAAIAAAAWALAMIVFAERMSKVHSLRLKAAKHKNTAEKEKAKAVAKRDAAAENMNKATAKQTEIDTANTKLVKARGDRLKADSALTDKQGELETAESDQAQKLTERKDCQRRIATADAELTLHECEGLNKLGQMEHLNTKIQGLDQQAAKKAVTTAQQGLASARDNKTTQLGHMKTAVDGKVVAGKKVNTKVGEVDALERKQINAASNMQCAQAEVQMHVANKAAHEEHDKKQQQLIEEVTTAVTDAVSAGMSAKTGMNNKAEVPDSKAAASDKPATTTPTKKSSASAETPQKKPKVPVKKPNATPAPAATTATKTKVPVKKPNPKPAPAAAAAS